MATPLYSTDIIPLTSRPTLTVMDDGDYFAILDTSTGKISKILRTNAQKALNISYNNATSGLTATQVQAALDELVVNLGSSDSAISALGGRLDILEADELTEGSIAYDIKQSSDALKGVGYTEGTLKTHEDRLGVLENDVDTEGSVLKSIKDNAEDATYDNTDSGLTASTLKTAIDENAGDIDDLQTAETAMKGTGWTNENLVDHEDRLDTLEGADTVEGSVAKTVKDAVEPIETRIDSTELTLARQGQDLASVKQTLQQGNGATLDFSDIGTVALDARATGRANPTIEGRTATNLVKNGDFSAGITGWSAVLGGNITVDNSIGQFIATQQNSFMRSNNIKSIANNRFYIKTEIKLTTTTNSIKFGFFDGVTGVGNSIDVLPITSWQHVSGIIIPVNSSNGGNVRISDARSSGFDAILVDRVICINLTATFGAGNEPSEADCAKIFSYFDGTKSIQLPARLRSVSEDESETSTLYIADNEEVRSVQAVSDTVSVVNGEHMLTKKISTPVSVLSGVAVNVTNYPTAKTGGKFAVELTEGGTQIGIIGTDSTSGAGTLRFELDTPVITNLLTSGILQAKPNGTVYFEPYYEGSHQTNASSQITLPYEGTIDKITGYDENIEPYEVPSTGYTLVGTTLTVTGAEENEVFYVELSRSEPLAPEMSVNTLNNEQVIADTANGKFYKLVPTITNGSLVSQTPVEVV